MEAIQKLTMLLVVLAVHGASGQMCEPGWEQYGGSCYSFGEEPVTWIDAMNYCELHKAHLVHINDRMEDTFLVQSMKGKGFHVAWTGATERLHRGTWEWSPSKAPLERHFNWYGTEPIGQEEDCMVIDSGYSYKWVDTSCTFSYKFICELETSLPTSASFS